ncbi:MAG: hypothetical protein GY898_30590 [Proteobacteria bacterium]|nr:hypothetical protein [Pseudomonadota bacterium]
MPRRRFTLAGWVVDLAHQRIERDGVARTLSTKEAELLGYLARQPGVSVPRAELLAEVWGYAPGASTRTLDVTVARLRRKLEDQPPRCLLTDRGTGYRLAGSAPVRRLVGRDEDVAEIRRAVGAGAPLVTVLGPPGSGTTSLAAHAAEQLDAVFVDRATAGQAAPALSEGRLIIATASAPLVLAGEHRHRLRPLSDADAVALLTARLDAAGLVRTASVDRRLTSLAAGLEGHVGLLVAASDRLAEAGLANLSLTVEELEPARFALAAARDPAGPCGDLAALVDGVPEAHRVLLAAAAARPRTLDEVEQLGPTSASAALPWLLDRSMLVRSEAGYSVPLPLRLWLRDARAASAAEAIQS